MWWRRRRRRRRRRCRRCRCCWRRGTTCDGGTQSQPFRPRFDVIGGIFMAPINHFHFYRRNDVGLKFWFFFAFKSLLRFVCLSFLHFCPLWTFSKWKTKSHSSLSLSLSLSHFLSLYLWLCLLAKHSQGESESERNVWGTSYSKSPWRPILYFFILRCISEILDQKSNFNRQLGFLSTKIARKWNFKLCLFYFYKSQK